MTLRGPAILRILEEQRETALVLVVDLLNGFSDSVPPDRALNMARTRFPHCIAVGHPKCIRRLTLIDPRGWTGGSHTTRRIRDDAGIIISPPQIREHKPLLT